MDTVELRDFVVEVPAAFYCMEGCGGGQVSNDSIIYYNYGTCVAMDQCQCKTKVNSSELAYGLNNCSKVLCNPECKNGYCRTPDNCACDPGWSGDDCGIALCTMLVPSVQCNCIVKHLYYPLVYLLGMVVTPPMVAARTPTPVHVTRATGHPTAPSPAPVRTVSVLRVKLEQEHAGNVIRDTLASTVPASAPAVQPLVTAVRASLETATAYPVRWGTLVRTATPCVHVSMENVTLVPRGLACAHRVTLGTLEATVSNSAPVSMESVMMVWV